MKIKTIAVHSHKGGVGKTTTSLLLARYAAEHDLQTCVIDLDFIGSGMSDLLAFDQGPELFLDSFLGMANPRKIDPELLLATPSSRGKMGENLRIILNLGWGADSSKNKLKCRAIYAVAYEDSYHVVRRHTRVLIDKLAAIGFKLVVLDCSPGLDFVSKAARDLAGTNLYVTTPNRSDCIGLLTAVNRYQLDSSTSFLLVNRATTDIVDPTTFHARIRKDSLADRAAAAILSRLKNLGKKGKLFAALPESATLRSHFHLGKKAVMPTLSACQEAAAMCAKVIKVAKP